MTIDVSFDEAFKGATRKLTYRIPSTGETQTITVKIPAGAVDGGKVRHKIPAGTQDGKTFRFRNAGAPDVKRRSGRGSLLVTVKVVVPTRLTSDERELLGKLRENDVRDYRKDVEAHG